jgi:hypothetical protein
MIRSTILFAGLFFVFGIAVETLNACTCQHLYLDKSAETISRQIDGTDYIFSGRVTSVRKNLSGRMSFPTYLVTLQVTKRWKGLDSSIKTVTTTSGATSMCNFPFEARNEYLVYARQVPTKKNAKGRNKEVSTSLCSRTRSLSDAPDDLSILNKANDRN